MLDATIILQILWTSLATSSYYVLFAVAFALVLKVTGLFNFAQAAIMTIAFYTAHVAVQWMKWPAWLAFVLMMAATLVSSWMLERVGFEALRKRGVTPMFVFVFTFLVSEFVAYLAMLVFWIMARITAAIAAPGTLPMPPMMVAATANSISERPVSGSTWARVP